MLATSAVRRFRQFPSRCPSPWSWALASSILWLAVPASAQVAEFAEWISQLREPAYRNQSAYTPPSFFPDSLSAVGFLLRHTDNRDPVVRQYVVAALGEAPVSDARIAESLGNRLLDSDELVRAQAVVGLGKRGEEALPVVLQFLSHPVPRGTAGRDDRFQRSSECRLVGEPPALAATALGLLGGRARDSIAAAVPRLSPERRSLAAFAISRMGAYEPDLFQHLLRDGDPLVREVAALSVPAMGLMASPMVGSVPGIAIDLGSLLGDQEVSVRLAAAAAVDAIAPHVPVGDRQEFLSRLTAGLRIRQTAGVLRSTLSGIGKLRHDGAPAAPLIVSFAQATSRDVVLAALGALAETGGGDEATVFEIERVLRRATADDVIQAAARALAGQGTPGIESLVKVALEPSVRVRNRVAALTRLLRAAEADARVRESLRLHRRAFGRLRAHSSSDIARVSSLLMGVLDGERRDRFLSAAIADRDTAVWAMALEGLERAEPNDLRVLIEHAQVGDDPRRRQAAIRSLGRAGRGDPRPAAVLRGALEENDPSIRRAAAQAFAALGPAARGEAPRLIARLAVADTSERAALLGAIASMSPLGTSTLPTLTAWLSHSDSIRRQDAAALLGAMGPAASPAREHLRVAVRGSDRTVAALAAAALVSIEPQDSPEPESVTALFDGAVRDLVIEAMQDLNNMLLCPQPTAQPTPDVGHIRILTSYPWPPPAPSVRDAVGDVFEIQAARTLGEIHQRVQAGLYGAGFVQMGLYGVPNGFAITPHLERIHPDGTPSHDRWTRTRLPSRSIGQWLAHTFLGQPGRFRLITIAVTNDFAFGTVGTLPSGEEALKFEGGGSPKLPSDVEAQALNDDYDIIALVYQFERQRNSLVSTLEHRGISAREHLILAGIIRGPE